MTKSHFRVKAVISPVFTLLLGLTVSLLVQRASLAEELITISDVQACRAIAANAQRLLCYDTVADGNHFNPEQVQEAQEVQEAQGADSGAGNSRPDDSADASKRLSVTVVRVNESETGVHYFYTEDEQVWKQNSRANWSLKAPFQAELKAGALGSWFLVTDGGKSARVKRVK